MAVKLDFVVNDARKNFPRRPVDVRASQEELDAFASDGYLMRRQLLTSDQVERLREAVDELTEAELNAPTAEVLPGNGFYIRSLLDKHRSFHELIRFQPTLSVARALIGPQVWFDIDARVAFAGVPEARVPWHIHMRVVPEPFPPFFCFPHQIHVIVYLDPVGEDEGQLCLLPGSHLRHDLRADRDEVEFRRDQMLLTFEPGDCLLIHGNLWHGTLPTTDMCGPRRLLLMGYQPSWIKSEVARGVKVSRGLTDELRATGDPELIELLDGWHW